MFKSAFFLIASILLFFTGNLLATNYYISTNSTGSANASSWTNKKIYTSFSWSTLIGGDTVYFDGGSDSLTYGKVLISSLLPSSQVVITNGKDATHNGKAIITLTSNAPAGSEDGAFTLQHCKNVKVTGLTFKIAAAPTTPDTYVNFVVFFNYGGSLINPSSNVLDNCHLISTGNGSLLDLGGETKDTIKNCIMEIPINTIGEEQDGINVYAGGGGHTFIGNTVTIGGMGGTHHKDLMQWGGGEGLDNNYETVIANNLFAYVAPAAVGLGNGGLYIENIHSNRFLIYNNIVSVRVSDPMTCLCIAPDDATYEVYNISARVYNNTFINGTYHGMGVRFDYADTLIFKNNIVIDDSVGGSIFYTKYRGLGYIKYKDIDYNQYYINGTSVFIDTSGSGTISFANWQSLKGYDTHGSAGNVTFANRWGTHAIDYKISSADIDNGTSISITSPAIDGTIRPQGTAYDRGAFEYTSGIIVNNPVPTLTSISPNTADAGSTDLLITITGTNFISSSMVQCNGSSLVTKYISSTSLTATIPAAQLASAGSVNITVFSATPGGGTTAAKTFTITAPNGGGTIPGATVNLIALLESYFVAGGTQMILSPWVTVELHNATAPYALVDSNSSTLSTSGLGTFTFTKLVSGINYFLVVKSFNTVETWSATPINFTTSSLSYNFTTSVTQAYTDGSNPPLSLHNGKYCIYSGDLNHDGYVNSSDYSSVDNDNSLLTYHSINDLNGDGYITSADDQAIDNNNLLAIHRQVPAGTLGISITYKKVVK